MKSFIKTIIFISLIFSIASVKAYDDAFEKAFNFNTGVEELSLKLSSLDYYNFKNQNISISYYQIKRADKIMRDWIMTNYENGNFGYYQTAGIIKNYNNFIYHTNLYFYYNYKKELYSSYLYDEEILKQYKNMKTYYQKVIYLVNKTDAN